MMMMMMMMIIFKRCYCLIGRPASLTFLTTMINDLI